MCVPIRCRHGSGCRWWGTWETVWSWRRFRSVSITPCPSSSNSLPTRCSWMTSDPSATNSAKSWCVFVWVCLTSSSLDLLFELKIQGLQLSCLWMATLQNRGFSLIYKGLVWSNGFNSNKAVIHTINCLRTKANWFKCSHMCSCLFIMKSDNAFMLCGEDWTPLVWEKEKNKHSSRL